MGSYCLICLKHRQKSSDGISNNEQEFVNILLQLILTEESGVEPFLNNRHSSLGLCTKCLSLVEEMKQLEDQVTQLQNQIKQRIVFVKKRISETQAKSNEIETDASDKTIEIRQLILSSNLNGTFPLKVDFDSPV